MRSVDPWPTDGLRVQGLVCERGGKKLFGPCDFALAGGTVVFVLGANGSGKSTLLRTVAGLSEPAAGEVSWAGAPLRFRSSCWRRGLAYVGHKLGLKDELSVEENLVLAVGMEGSRATAALLEQALERVGLAGRNAHLVRRLSQGQKQRLALARLCLNERTLWLLDEPSAALDTGGRSTLSDLLGDHLRRGGAALVATHDLIAIEAARSASLTIA
jgi:heme exporter protein A